jgi:predicted nucleotidyltransferase
LLSAPDLDAEPGFRAEPAIRFRHHGAMRLDGGPELAGVDRRQADEVVAIARGILGDGVLGAYLHGSAVLGGLRPTSDLDVLAVVDRSTIAAERSALVARLLEISGRRAYRGPARPVELTLLVASDVRPWSLPPRVEFVYGEWRRDDYERGFVPRSTTMHDFGPEVALTLAGNHALFGPPPATLLDPLPPAEIGRAVVAGIPSLLGELDSDTRNVLLTFARIWSTVVTEEITSKDDAAAWAIDRLPEEHRGVLIRARAMYLEGWDEDDWGEALPAVRAHASEVVAEIEREVRRRSNLEATT